MLRLRTGCTEPAGKRKEFLFMSEEAKEADTVKVHYTGKLDDGTVFDSSRERDPIEFTLGENQVIPGFEEAVAGMSPGESKETKIEAENAYGPFRNELVFELPKENFPEDAPLDVGQKFQASTRDGNALTVSIVEVGDDTITVDANHPFAGKDLTFELELVEIQGGE
jgi:peptidylprolyl isomerase